MARRLSENVTVLIDAISGNPYYHNTVSDEVSWTPPVDQSPIVSPLPAPPPPPPFLPPPAEPNSPSLPSVVPIYSVRRRPGDSIVAESPTWQFKADGNDNEIVISFFP